MNMEKSYPMPYQKIWAAAYIVPEKKTECFELRTVDESGKYAYKPLWHKEFPLGMALADFVHADFVGLEEHLAQVRALAGKNTAEADLQLCEIAAFWLKKSPLFAPMAAAIHRLRIEPTEKKALSAILKRYKALQDFLSFAMEDCLTVAETEDMVERYLGKTAEKPERYETLRYGSVSLEGVVVGSAIRYPFDDPMEYYFGGGELPQAEFYGAEVLNTEQVEDYIHFLVKCALQANVGYRVCKFCGKYFPMNTNHKTEYCDRLIDGSQKTCREMGSLRLYEKRILEDPAIRAYKRSYKAHNARIRYGLMTREQFSAWSKEARERRERCIAGELSLENFTAWLDSDRL